MPTQLDTEKFSYAIKLKRGSVGLRQTAKDIDIGFTTLSRLELGHVPDVDTYIKICKWLEVPTETFILGDKNKNDLPQNQLVTLLRSDKTLPPTVADALIQMIDLAYKQRLIHT